MRGLTKMFEKAPVLLLAAYSIAPAQDIKSVGKIIRLDPAFDALAPAEARIEKAAGGLTFTEGPLCRPEGLMWISNAPGNVVRSVTPSGEVKTIVQKAGGSVSAPPGDFIGLDGMISDKDGAVLL